MKIVEKLKDLSSRMRSDASNDECTPDGIMGQTLNSYADEIDSLAKDAIEIDEGQCGNPSALREAAEKTRATLEEALKILNEISDGEAGKLNARIEDVADAICEVTQQTIPAALAEPARNCDVGTPRQQADRMRHFCLHDQGGCGVCSRRKDMTFRECVMDWAQMPYTEGENDGNE